MIQLQITTTADNVEIISEFLTATGAAAVTLQDAADHPILEPELNTTPVWPETQICGLFTTLEQAQQISAQLQNKLGNKILACNIITIDDQDWVAAYHQTFQPRKFGKNLWICPSWHQPPNKNDVVVNLDPGLAFGTGSHPTTALCLEWLAKKSLTNKTVIDYGCGSGILGIAALKLGARHVWAIDHDPQALQATSENAQHNQIDPATLTISTPEQLPNEPVDIIVANILAKPLITLAPLFAKLLKPQGEIILSGILADQALVVAAAYVSAFTIAPVFAEQDGWIRIEGQKKS